MNLYEPIKTGCVVPELKVVKHYDPVKQGMLYPFTSAEISAIGWYYLANNRQILRPSALSKSGYQKARSFFTNNLLKFAPVSRDRLDRDFADCSRRHVNPNASGATYLTALTNYLSYCYNPLVTTYIKEFGLPTRKETVADTATNVVRPSASRPGTDGTGVFAPDETIGLDPSEMDISLPIPEMDEMTITNAGQTEAGFMYGLGNYLPWVIILIVVIALGSMFLKTK